MFDRASRVLYRWAFGPCMVRRLRLAPDDLVLVRFPRDFPSEALNATVNRLALALPHNVIVALTGDLTLEQLPRERLLAAAEMAKPSKLDHQVWV